jgi:hypothetical protein
VLEPAHRGALDRDRGGIERIDLDHNYYFQGKLPEGSPEARNHKRLGLPGNLYAWGRFHDA